jgi:hypothetical protein
MAACAHKDDIHLSISRDFIFGVDRRSANEFQTQLQPNLL